MNKPFVDVLRSLSSRTAVQDPGPYRTDPRTADRQWAEEYFESQKPRLEAAARSVKWELAIASWYSFEADLCKRENVLSDTQLLGRAEALKFVLEWRDFKVKLTFMPFLRNGGDEFVKMWNPKDGPPDTETRQLQTLLIGAKSSQGSPELDIDLIALVAAW